MRDRVSNYYLLFRRLCVLDESVCWTHCHQILECDERQGVQLFIKHQLANQEQFIETALDVLR